MIKFLFITVTIFMFAPPVTAQEAVNAVSIEQSQEYIKIINEVPLMDNLYEVVDSELVFDKPNGRIAEIIYFSDSVTSEEVESYYAEVLPQLGWVASESNSDTSHSFAREQEILTFITSENGGEVVVKFNIFPYENPVEK